MSTPLPDIPGRKIRRQYFNVFIYMLLYFCFMILFFEFAEGGQSLHSVGQRAREMVFLLPILLILGVLSLLNRFFFGRVVAVPDSEGLHTAEGFFRWEDITAIRYTPSLPRRYGGYIPNAATLTVKVGETLKRSREVTLPMVPFHLLFSVRRRARHIKVGISRFGWILFIVLAVAPFACMLLSRLTNS